MDGRPKTQDGNGTSVWKTLGRFQSIFTDVMS